MNYDGGGLFFETFPFAVLLARFFMIDERLFDLLYWAAGLRDGWMGGEEGSIYCAGRCFRFYPGERGGGRKWDCLSGLGGWL